MARRGRRALSRAYAREMRTTGDARWRGACVRGHRVRVRCGCMRRVEGGIGAGSRRSRARPYRVGDIARGTRGDVGRGGCVCVRGDVMRACA